MAWWQVTCEPRPEQLDVEGVERAPAGVVVYVTDGQVKSVVGRVAYSRWAPYRWRRSFKRSLLRVVARAEEEARRLNEAERPRTAREARAADALGTGDSARAT